MLHKILLPVDMTDRHAPALALAADMAGTGGEVVLLHVIEVIAGLSVEEEKPFYQRLEKAAQAHLERLGGELVARKVSSRAVIRFGNRVAEVARFAVEDSTELIVLTAPRFAPNEPAAGLASLSHQVGLFSPCHVLLVK